MDGKENLLEFLRLAVGYSMTGTTREKVVFFCYGEGGDNGKTTFLGTLRALFGEYGQLLSIDTLMTKQQEDNNVKADLADLFGARFVMTSEVDDGQRLSEGRLKKITQGDAPIKACRKYENPFEFPESHKLWIDCNYLPVISTGGKALWNRIRVIPWLITIPKPEQDPELKAKFISEAEGILAWAIGGAVDWYRRGLPRVPGRGSGERRIPGQDEPPEGLA
jgi:putative DNA primase/helicase